MPTIYDAKSVDPDDVTAEQLDEVFAEHGMTRATSPVPDLPEPGKTYRRYRNLFRCAAIGIDHQRGGGHIALGYMPVNLGIGLDRTWEVAFLDGYDWSRGWDLVPDEAPSCGNCRRPFDPADRRFDGAAEYDDTGFCRGCVDNCHEAGIGHRCAVCKALTERSSR